jgi:hypothetical protein
MYHSIPRIAPVLFASALVALLASCAHHTAKIEKSSEIAGVDQALLDSVASTGLILRDPPLRDLKTNATIHAADFGIQPDTGENIAPALAKLTAHLATLSEPTLVVFEKGTYRAAVPDAEMRAVFAFNRLQNLVIDGNGAEIIVNTPLTHFSHLIDCKNIIIRNFVVDGDPLPFTQGTVVGIDAEKATFDLQIDDGYRELSNENLAYSDRFSRRWGMLKDREIPGRLKFGAPNHFLVELITEAVGERTFRLQLKNKNHIRSFEEGDRYVQFIDGVATSNYLQDSADITFQNITLYCAKASYLGIRNKNINILACRTILRDDRLISSVADGVLLQTGASGPWIEDVVFEGISDDAVNIYQKPIFVREVLGPDRLLLTREHTPFGPGDKLAFFDPVEGRVLGRLRVVSVQQIGDAFETVFDGPVPEVRIGGVQVLGGGAKGADLAGAGREATHLYNENYLSGPAVIRNSVFKNSRNIAIKIQSHNVLVENVHIEGWDRYGIFIANLVNYPEGFLGDNFIVRNNLIKDCGFNQNRVDAVYARFQALGQVPSASADAGNLRITDNLIVNPGARGIDIASFSGVEVRGNTLIFADDCERPAAISIVNAPNATLIGNIILTSNGATADALISLDSSVKPSDNTILTNQGEDVLTGTKIEWQAAHGMKSN